MSLLGQRAKVRSILVVVLESGELLVQDLLHSRILNHQSNLMCLKRIQRLFHLHKWLWLDLQLCLILALVPAVGRMHHKLKITHRFWEGEHCFRNSWNHQLDSLYQGIQNLVVDTRCTHHWQDRKCMLDKRFIYKNLYHRKLKFQIQSDNNLEVVLVRHFQGKRNPLSLFSQLPKPKILGPLLR